MKYSIHNLAVVRSPLKPIKTKFNEAEIISLFSQQEIQEALYIATPVLLNEFKKIKDKPPKDKERIILSLLKYALRMHARCTPFGLFSGCGILDLSKDLNTKITSFTRQTRLDMGYVTSLAQTLLDSNEIFKDLLLFPNSTIYKLNKKLRYVNYKNIGGQRLYQITSIEYNSLVNFALKKARKGIKFNDLVALICSVSEDITNEEADGFVKELVDSQILITTMEPSMAGKEYLGQIEDTLEAMPFNPVAERILLKIREVQTDLVHIDNLLPCNQLDIYEKTITKIEKFGASMDKSKLFQVDLFIKYEQEHDSLNQGDSQFKKDIARALTAVNKLSTPENTANLTNFKAKFYERYENAEVPLILALDSESGIGYGKNSRTNEQTNQKNQLIWDKKSSFLFEKILEWKVNNLDAVYLNENDLETFSENWDDLPPTMALNIRHVGKIGDKDIIQYKGAMGASAISMLGRFSFGNEAINEFVKEIEKFENDFYGENYILAEILHLPESRTGNVLLRPTFRAYEIPYLSKPSVDIGHQMPIDDLMISMKNNELILRSKRHNKQVLPRLGNAHNYLSTVLPIYHFLCDMQTSQTRKGLSFSWGASEKIFKIFPRIYLNNNIILSPATWILKKEDISNWYSLNDEIDLCIFFLEWRKLNGNMPEKVYLIEGDNELLIDFSSELSIKMLISSVKNYPYFIISEYIFDPDSAILKDNNHDSFTNEILTVVYKEHEGSGLLDKRSIVSTPSGDKESFSIGSEWVYYKIYCGAEIAEDILINTIRPLMASLLSDSIIKKWFFIKYNDPENHIRLRLNVVNVKEIQSILEAVHKKLQKFQKQKLIWKLQLETYIRETDRYGKKNIGVIEEIFQSDSELVLKLLKNFDRDDDRMFAACLIIDKTLDSFHLPILNRSNLLDMLKSAFYLEFNIDKPLKMALDQFYRDKKASLVNFLEGKPADDHLFRTSIIVHFKKIDNKINQIVDLYKAGQLDVELNDIIISLIHMSLNRLFIDNQRKNELSIYDMMSRYYKSKKAFSK